MIASSTSATESQNVHDDGVCKGMIFHPSKRRAQALHFAFRFRPAIRRDKAQFTIALCATIETAHYRAAIASLCTGPHVCVMSALPPKADMCGAARDVCFGPKADIRSSLFENLSLGQQRKRHTKIECPCCFKVDHERELGWLLDRQIAGVCTFRMRSMYPAAWRNYSAKSAP